MTEIKNWPWEIIIALIVAIPTVWIALLALKRKILTYEILTNTEVFFIPTNPILKDKLKVTFDGNPVKNIRLYKIRFQNSGNVPIVKADIHSELIVDFSKIGKILNFEILEMNPADFDMVLFDYDDDYLKCGFSLMNRNDSFALRILVDQDSETPPVIHGRLVGTKIKQKKQLSVMIFYFITCFFLLLLFSFLVLDSDLLTKVTIFKFGIIFLIFAMFLTGIVLRLTIKE